MVADALGENISGAALLSKPFIFFFIIFKQVGFIGWAYWPKWDARDKPFLRDLVKILSQETKDWS